MKALLIILFISFGFQVNQNTIYCFDFNSKTDYIIYRKNKEISGFNLFINDKYRFFSSALPLKNISQRKAKNINRRELNNKIKIDNPNKSITFFIKYNNKYYESDYIVRTIRSK